MNAKIVFKHMLLAISLLAITAVLVACDLALEPKNSAGFSIELPSTNSARNLGIEGGLPKFAAVAQWKITGKNASKDADFSKTFPGTAKTLDIDNISTGEWTIEVVGLDTGDVTLFNASVNCTLLAGVNDLIVKMIKDPNAFAEIQVEGPKDIYNLTLIETILTGAAFYFGDIGNSGPPKKIQLSITNTGNSDLILFANLEHSDTGFSFPTPPKSPVKPSETTIFEIAFTSTGTTGNKYDALTISTNVPNPPDFVLNLSGTYC